MPKRLYHCVCQKNHHTVITTVVSLVVIIGTVTSSGYVKRCTDCWRPDGTATKEINGRDMKWCSNDCHPKPMWCGRMNCLNKADFAKKMEEKKAGDGENNSSTSNGSMPKDFKIALAAMTSPEDFKFLESKFLQGN